VEDLPEGLPLTADSLEAMALANNPAIAQATARIAALRGKWVQAGLPPNPTAGYSASEIGNQGAAGQQGGYVGQKFITGKKLQRNQVVVAAEISRAEQDLVTAEQRVRTDVRKGYFAALLAQRGVSLAEELVRVYSQAVTASKDLLDSQEIPLAGLLQTEVQQENAELLLRTARNRLNQAWRNLSAVVGDPGLTLQPLEGDVDQIPAMLGWEEQLSRLQTLSPEIASAMAEVDRARRALGRARVEAVPDISTQLSVQYDDSTGSTITGVQVGLPLPIWNRNQGGVRQAQAEVAEANRNVDRVELNLQRRLADAFRQYSDADVTAHTYANDILPRSRRTYELVRAAYEQGEVGYLELLVAQQTYSQTNLGYLDALGELWASYLQIDGLMLEGSLQRPN
jgi:cobalt-zinc-cadmium efflux system outer membrane protein